MTKKFLLVEASVMQNFSKKMALSLPMPKFIKKLITDLKVLDDHLYCVHMQFKAFKNAWEHASTDMNVATLKVDWSENPTLTQAWEEKLVYYHNYQIGLHTVNLWSTDGNQSVSRLSGYTDHKATAVTVM